MTTTYRIRKHTYRDKAGWLVSAPGNTIYTERVFFEHESAARRFLANKNADRTYECTLADFEPVAS